jgi:hypothetical protein
MTGFTCEVCGKPAICSLQQEAILWRIEGDAFTDSRAWNLEEEMFLCWKCAEREGLEVEWGEQPHGELEKEVGT